MFLQTIKIFGLATFKDKGYAPAIFPKVSNQELLNKSV